MIIKSLHLFADKPENVQFETSATDNKACENETISINCSADAVPFVTSYELFENGVVILDTSGMWSRTLSSGGVFIYKCVANNSLGSTESESVTVTVNGKQSFLLKLFKNHVDLFLIRAQNNSIVWVCRYTSDLGMLRFYRLPLNNIFNTHEGVSLKPWWPITFHFSLFSLL